MSNRIIYNTQGLFISPYSGEFSAIDDFCIGGHKTLKRIEKIQQFDYSIAQTNISLREFGVNRSVFFDAIESPEIDFNFSYIPDGITNENRMNFNVNHFSGLRNEKMFSGLLSNSENFNKRDFYLAIRKDENDYNFSGSTFTNDFIRPTSTGFITDPNSTGYSILHFQNCYLREYSFNISVGALPQVSQTYVADNLNYYISGSGLAYIKIDPKSGQMITENEKIIFPKYFKYNQTNISGQNLLSHNKLGVTISSSSNTGVLFYSEDLQSLNYSITFNRLKLTSLNYRLPLYRPIKFPVEGSINLGLLVNKDLSGSFFDQLNKNLSYNLTLNFKENMRGVYPTQLIFSGCKFNKISYTSSIENERKADLNFNFNLDQENNNCAIFSSGNLLYGMVGSTKKVLIF